MRIVDHLSEDQLKRLNYNKKDQTKVNKRKAVRENVDWEEIMGMNRGYVPEERGSDKKEMRV
jgi:hypothetical protein